MLAKFKSAAIAGVASLVVAGVLVASPVMAQDKTFSESHIAAARKAVKATKSIESFDNILPDVAERTRTLFIRSNPAMSAEIDAAVNETAVELIPRRKELNYVIYEVWARRFSEEQLNEIAAFYNSETGKRMADLSRTLTALTIGAAKQWSDAIGTDMVSLSRRKLDALSAQ